MGRIWAVAINTVRQAVRMRVAVIFSVLLLVLVPTMGFTMTGDGTLKGRLQTFIAYGMSLTALLLYLLTLIVSAYTITSDIRNMQIFTVLTKPIRRFELVLGKFLGVVLLDVMLLVLFSAVIYAIAVKMPAFVKAAPEEAAQAEKEFFTARRAIRPETPDVTAEVDETYERLRRTGQLPQGVDADLRARLNYKRELATRAALARRAAGVGQELIWEFHDVKLSEPNLFVRYKYDVSVNPADLQVYGRWVVGDDRPFRVSGVQETPVYTFDRKDAIRTTSEIEIPGDCVAKDGYVAVGFYNPPLNSTVVIFPPGQGLEILYKADTFTANFVRAVILILLRLVLLAALGVMAGTFLSFPVAMLLCLSVFGLVNVSGFVLESFEYVGKEFSTFYNVAVKAFIQIFPQFDKFSTSTFLVGGRLLSWTALGRQGFVTVGVEAVVLLSAALLIFRFKEIAKATL